MRDLCRDIGGIGIKKLKLILIFLICVSLTASLAASKPDGLLMKGKVRTYSAGIYNANQPLSVCINTNGNSQTDNEMSTFVAFAEELENENLASDKDPGQLKLSESSNSGGIHGFFKSIFQ